MDADTPTDEILGELFVTVESRKIDLPEDSYTMTLFTHERGKNYILEELSEETMETILAAKNDDGEKLLYENADLICHLLVLLSMKDTPLGDLRDELKARF